LCCLFIKNFKKIILFIFLRNFLLKNEKIIIGDFGVSKALVDHINIPSSLKQGSIPYMSPEMLTYPTTNISLKTDIW
jgi:serine/threonine protein kinase